MEDGSNTMRIVLLGKTGAGKSSLANIIFGEDEFNISHTLNSGTSQCRAETRSVNGRSITLIDTPGLFYTDRSEEELKPEIVRCITECAPGPHAFLIVLKVDIFTDQEQVGMNKIQEYFSDEVFKYATVVFTHGDQLPEGETIKKFVCDNRFVSDLVKKCGERCHVIDNKYWRGKPKHEYRSNQFQAEALLKTMDMMTEANNGGCYTNEMLQASEKKIQEEKGKLSSADMSKEAIRQQAKIVIASIVLTASPGVTTAALMGLFLSDKVLSKTIALVLGVAKGSARRAEASQKRWWGGAALRRLL